jgi:hypothetical protein
MQSLLLKPEYGLAQFIGGNMTKWCLKEFTHGTHWSSGLRDLAVFLICLLLGSLSLQAQLQTGSFSGTVQDQLGAVVSGATITLVNQATTDARKTVSNDSGYFTFAGVIPGTYSITVKSKGFKAWKQSDMALNVGDSRTINGR